MSRILHAAPAALLALGLATGPAAAATVVIVDPSLNAAFQKKREIVDVIKQEYGADAVYANGDDLPADISSEIATGEKVPSDATMTPVPQSLAMKLPKSQPGTRWVEIGEHLVEVDKNDVAHLVVYDVLR